MHKIFITIKTECSFILQDGEDKIVAIINHDLKSNFSEKVITAIMQDLDAQKVKHLQNLVIEDLINDYCFKVEIIIDNEEPNEEYYYLTSAVVY